MIVNPARTLSDRLYFILRLDKHTLSALLPNIDLKQPLFYPLPDMPLELCSSA